MFYVVKGKGSSGPSQLSLRSCGSRGNGELLDEEAMRKVENITEHPGEMQSGKLQTRDAQSYLFNLETELEIQHRHLLVLAS